MDFLAGEFQYTVEPHGHSPWHPTSLPSGATSRPNAGAFIHGQSPWPSAAGVIFIKIQCSPYFNPLGTPVEKERSKETFRESKTEEGIGMEKGRLFVLAMVLCLFTGTIVLAQVQKDIQKHPSC